MAGDIDLAGNATTAWHEAGHLLGLNHTSESDGSANDYIDGTPNCTADDDDDGVSEDECADGVNFMFHDTDNTGMTDGQTFVIANHPLFYADN